MCNRHNQQNRLKSGESCIFFSKYSCSFVLHLKFPEFYPQIAVEWPVGGADEWLELLRVVGQQNRSRRTGRHGKEEMQSSVTSELKCLPELSTCC